MNLLKSLFISVSMLMTTAAGAQPATAAPEHAEETIYLFSGLGADHRAFDRLQLPGYRLIHIRWVPPQRKESMSAYATRIRGQIDTSDPILIGLSFGGMMAVEVAKQIPVKKIVLISSAKTRSDLAAASSFFFKWRLYKYVPGYLLQQPNFIANRLFGAETASDKEVLGAILEDTNVPFFRWAMDNIVDWDNETIPPRLIHIHGTNDKIIPFKAVKADYAIEGGGHLMVLNRADTISSIILHFLHS